MLWYTLLFLLAGCAQVQVSPTNLGYKQSSWETMSDGERQNAIMQYQRVVSKRYALRGGALTAGQYLEISLADGTASMGPERERLAYRPVSVEMGSQDVCRQVMLYAKQSSGLSAPLLVCIDDSYVYIDPSYQNEQYALGSLAVPVNHLLKQGVAFCDLQTQGLAGLEKVCLTIKLRDSNEARAEKSVWRLHPASVDDRYVAHVQVESL